MDTLLHLADPKLWAAAADSGSYTGSTQGRSLAEEGFVHCSFESQLAGVAAAIYAGTPTLVLLEIDPERLGGVPVRVEPVPGSTERFPHVYGPIPTAAVTSATQVQVDEQGRIRSAGMQEDPVDVPDQEQCRPDRGRFRPAAGGWSGPGTAPAGSTRPATG